MSFKIFLHFLTNPNLVHYIYFFFFFRSPASTTMWRSPGTPSFHPILVCLLSFGIPGMAAYDVGRFTRSHFYPFLWN